MTNTQVPIPDGSKAHSQCHPPTGKLEDVQKPWPVRYRVTVRHVTGESRTFTVLTWLNRDKAVAMAAQADGQRFGASAGLYDVEVEELGPAPQGTDGTVDVESDLHDRMEF